ncbi:hypothetical protein QBC32DRAFT_345625 [Pseudoneurospora amorphoporcata]|uniref:Uncharacterized protein n=1 Tax=Pseudoneurospora amorphoporcata TaxID=241081 RepID=A0AAN6NV72_9PEZI|nr:hypothetical protein QBC32DRAFT_345625 [Pseudoneurospora amorphoporcata]
MVCAMVQLRASVHGVPWATAMLLGRVMIVSVECFAIAHTRQTLNYSRSQSHACRHSTQRSTPSDIRAWTFLLASSPPQTHLNPSCITWPFNV